MKIKLLALVVAPIILSGCGGGSSSDHAVNNDLDGSSIDTSWSKIRLLCP